MTRTRAGSEYGIGRNATGPHLSLIHILYIPLSLFPQSMISNSALLPFSAGVTRSRASMRSSSSGTVSYTHLDVYKRQVL